MKKELSIIANEDLTNCNLTIKGSTTEVLFLFFQMVNQLIKNEVCDIKLLKSIIDLTVFSDKLEFNLNEKELEGIAKCIMKGINENE